MLENPKKLKEEKAEDTYGFTIPGGTTINEAGEIYLKSVREIAEKEKLDPLAILCSQLAFWFFKHTDPIHIGDSNCYFAIVMDESTKLQLLPVLAATKSVANELGEERKRRKEASEGQSNLKL